MAASLRTSGCRNDLTGLPVRIGTRTRFRISFSSQNSLRRITSSQKDHLPPLMITTDMVIATIKFEEFPMITDTSAVAFCQNLGDMHNQVHNRGNCIVTSKDGKPITVLVKVRLFERIRRFL